ncbi:hypothetical protein [Streptomyces hygroscopicus]|uniref:hypothetical protein n=1 Tax=Streptomyces hygroscopicus TaxID=1912 RepID=UPI0008241847|nr:hypothetical protein [Streptomyces hygroscopicus]
MTTPRAVRDDITNLAEYLLDAEIAVYINPVSIDGTRVSWHSLNPSLPFLTHRGDPGLEDYRRWVEAGAFSGHLFDGALLQLTYDVEGARSPATGSPTYPRPTAWTQTSSVSNHYWTS